MIDHLASINRVSFSLLFAFYFRSLVKSSKHGVKQSKKFLIRKKEKRVGKNIKEIVHNHKRKYKKIMDKNIKEVAVDNHTLNHTQKKLLTFKVVQDKGYKQKI